MSAVVYRDRPNTDSTKWDNCEEKFGRGDLLPLWIADMDFEAPPCVKEALRRYVDFGVFGYYLPPEGYQDAFIRWEKQRHQVTVEREWLRFAPGVVPALNWLIHLLTREGDGVLIMPPVYYPFRDAIVNNRRRVVENPLIRRNQGYEIDFEDLETKLGEEDVRLLLFCSPHNPAGRVWKEAEIRRVLELCERYGVYVISDEIHQDLIMKGNRHVSAAGQYPEKLITVTAATKTFNLAACQNSILIIPDRELRERYDDYLERLRIRGGNAFGYIAVQSAYEEGGPWLDEVLEIIEGNANYLKQTLEKALPEVWIPELEGTYLMWIDLGAYGKPGNLETLIRDRCRLAVDYGEWFGGEEYKTFIRVNLATRRENIEEAARRIIGGIWQETKEKKGS